MTNYARSLEELYTELLTYGFDRSPQVYLDAAAENIRELQRINHHPHLSRLQIAKSAAPAYWLYRIRALAAEALKLQLSA